METEWPAVKTEPPVVKTEPPAASAVEDEATLQLELSEETTLRRDQLAAKRALRNAAEAKPAEVTQPAPAASQGSLPRQSQPAAVSQPVAQPAAQQPPKRPRRTLLDTVLGCDGQAPTLVQPPAVLPTYDGPAQLDESEMLANGLLVPVNGSVAPPGAASAQLKQPAPDQPRFSLPNGQSMQLQPRAGVMAEPPVPAVSTTQPSQKPSFQLPPGEVTPTTHKAAAGAYSAASTVGRL